MKKIVSLFLAALLALSALPLALAEENPTLTIMLHANGRTWDPEASNNKKIMEICGVNLDVSVVNADTLTLSFSSGDLADIITLPGLTYAEYVSSGYLLPLNDLLKDAPNIMGRTTEFALDKCTIDGQIYAYPYENNNVKYFTTIRKDWLDNLGWDLSRYTTIPDSDVVNLPLEDYLKILNDFTFKDPDGNGKQDTYGLSYHGATSVEAAFMAFFGAFGGVMNQNYLMEDGKVWAYETTDAYRQALKCLNEQWVKGVIDPEIFILQQDQAKANLMAGKSGSFVSWWSTAFELIRDGMYDLQPTTQWVTASIVGPEGKAGMKDNGRVTSTISITTNCKNPELAMQFLNTLNSEECWWLIRYGIAGEHYNVDENGAYSGARTEEGQRLFSSMLLDTLYTLDNAIDLENAANSLYPTDPIMQVRWTMLVHQFLKEAPLYTDLFYGYAQTQEALDYSVDVRSVVEKSCMEFITGDVALTDANWEAYLSKWSSMGGSDILKSYVDAYNARNNTAYVPAL